MLFSNTLKLTFANFLQVFKVVFYILLSFLIVFGIMLTMSDKYFSILVHTRFFDNIVGIINGLFISLSVTKIASSIDALRVSFGEYITIIKSNGFMIEMLLGIGLTLVMMISIFWYRYAITKTMRSYTDMSKRVSTYNELMSKPKESIAQLLLSMLFCAIFDIICIFGLYYFVQGIMSWISHPAIQYVVFFISVLMVWCWRNVLFNGWEYVHFCTGESAIKSWITTIKQNTKHLASKLLSMFLLLALCWSVVILCGHVLAGYMVVLGMSFTYLCIKSYGVISYYEYTGEECYIFGKKVIFKKSVSAGIKY